MKTYLEEVPTNLLVAYSIRHRTMATQVQILPPYGIRGYACNLEYRGLWGYAYLGLLDNPIHTGINSKA